MALHTPETLEEALLGVFPGKNELIHELMTTFACMQMSEKSRTEFCNNHIFGHPEKEFWDKFAKAGRELRYHRKYKALIRCVRNFQDEHPFLVGFNTPSERRSGWTSLSEVGNRITRVARSLFS